MHLTDILYKKEMLCTQFRKFTLLGTFFFAGIQRETGRERESLSPKRITESR